MPATCRYDDSLPWLVDVLVEQLGVDRVRCGLILRDASGRLSFFSRDQLAQSERARVEQLIQARIGSYARADRLIVAPDELGASRILDSEDARIVTVQTTNIRYIDRRIIGADWLRAPQLVQATPARVVFSSLKGGVGRSTALSVVAVEQARRGRNVLVVDLDLEAPGIGSILLTGDRRPRFGSLDYLVERNFGKVDKQELAAFVGTSELTMGAGVVDVVPVVGGRSFEAPQNYLSKLARGYLEEVHHDASPLSLADKIAAMLREFELRRPYDLVLIDARAGLAELAAGPLLGLGANVLLFGTRQPQTLEGLTFLFAHLATLDSESQASPWRALKMVHAKAQLTEDVDRFKDELWELFSTHLYEELEGLEGFNFDVDAPEAPHNPIAIPLDIAFADWAPADNPSRLIETYYARTFGSLLTYIEEAVIPEAL